MKKFIPLKDRILIKRITIDKITKGGIFIPESAQEKPLEGEVVAVGPGRLVNNTLCPTSVKVGDRVLFSKYTETEINIQGRPFLLLKEDDILGIIE